MTLSAVRTTGIYCRPDCPARPNPENVVPYKVAAAAEAVGFRACHRCRPYRSAEVEPWLAGPELVCRAVRLVVSGGLDGFDEAHLAARVAVSARHLRRLLFEHVGTTPSALAQSRRAHFARRLLDDCDLSIADVAFAAGFGSVRQMNRVMHQTFGSSPSDLRSRRRRADRLVADGGLEVRLAFRPPLDWDSMIRFLAVRATPGVEVVDGATYRRTIDVEDQPGVVEVEPGGTDHLLARFHLPNWTGLIHLVARVRRLLDLDCDPTDVDRTLRGAGLRGWRSGLRVPGCWDPFETAVRAIAGQQVSVAGATTVMGAVTQALGEPVDGLAALGLSRLFPTAARLAAADASALPMPVRRGRAIVELARAMHRDEIDLLGASAGERRQRLVAIEGIGPWTADYLELRLGEPDAFCPTDLGLRRALGGVDAAQAEHLAEVWRPFRSYAAVHLWSASGKGARG